MDWDGLQHFLAIARHGTLSAAARALRVSQSTMSRRLETLETRIGTRLFTKTPQGYVLTLVGEAIRARVERMEAEAIGVERAIAGQDGRLEGVVRITAPETLAAIVLMPLLAAFRQIVPGVIVDLVADVRSLDLTLREADVAVRVGRPTQHDLIARRIGLMRFGVYAEPGYLRRRGMPDFDAGAPGHDVVALDRNATGAQDAEWLDELTHRATKVFQANSRLVVRAAIEAGLGIGCLARYLGDNSLNLVRLEVPTPAFSREVWMVTHEDIRRMPRVRAVTDYLVKEFGKGTVLDPP